jgi:hypothetical protein
MTMFQFEFLAIISLQNKGAVVCGSCIQHGTITAKKPSPANSKHHFLLVRDGLNNVLACTSRSVKDENRIGSRQILGALR